MHIHDRLALLISALGETPVTFSEKLGIQRSSVSHLLSARNKPSVDFLEKLLAVYPSVNLGWLIVGQGNMWTNAHTAENEPGLPNGAKTTDDISEATRDAFPTQPVENKGSIKKTPSKVMLLYADGSFEVFFP